MKKPRKALLGRAHLGAPPWPEKMPPPQPAVPPPLTSEIPVQFIIHHFSVFGNYLHFY
jgi:hypothetical protein